MKGAWFRDAPIGRKLLLIGLLTSGIALFVISLILSVRGALDWRERSLTEMETYARVIANNAAPAMMFDDRRTAAEVLSALSANPDIVDAVLYDRDGKVFARYNVLLHPPDMPPVRKGSYLFSAGQMIVSEPVQFKGGVLGTLNLESDLHSLYSGLLRDIGLTFLAAGAVFLLVTFLFSRLQKTIISPIVELANAMQGVSSGQDYGVRVAAYSKDEVGMLATNFNTMLERIQQRDDELERHRKHLEEMVAQRTARLTEAQRIAHLGNWEWDIVSNTLDWSEEIYRIFELTPQQFDATYEAFLQAVHPEDRPLVDAKVREGVEHGSPYSIDHRILLPDGSLRYVHEQAEVQCNEGGRGIKMQGTVQDITERKRAAQALEESERKFRAILDAAVDGILVADGQSHKFVTANRAICDMLGYPLEEMYQLGMEDIHPAEKLAEVQKGFELQLKGEMRMALNLPVKRKDGSVFFADVSASPMVLAGRSFLVGVFHDVSERKQAEEKINKLNEELEAKVKQRTQQLLDAQEELVRHEKLAVLGQVAGSVGHELRNPLGVMSNAVYFLQTVLADADDSVKEYLNIIKSEIAGSERIVSDLLDSVRTKPPQPEAVGVAELIAQTLGKLAIPPSVSVKLDIPATLPPLRVDAQQIHQVLRNLISNGIEAMPEGGTLQIGAVENRQDRTVTVSVMDSGSGIAQEQLSKLFQPLYTTKARGIGLGLVVVKNLTQANGGTVKVESEAGKGSLFAVILPAADETGVSI